MADTIRQQRLAAVGTALAGVTGIAGTPIYGYPKSLAPAAAKPAGTLWFWDVDQDYDSTRYAAANRLLADLRIGVMMTFSYTEDAPNAEGNKKIAPIWDVMMADPEWGNTVFETRPFTDEITDLATDTRRKLGAVWMGWLLRYFLNRNDPTVQ